MILSEKSIKVLVVDDSAFMRKVISDMLNSDSAIQVVGTARNGKDAIEKIQLLKPNVVTMDVEMPIMNGIDALDQIMKRTPLPVIMLSSITTEGADATLTALELGAIDFVQKPSSVFMVNSETLKKELIFKIKVGVNAQIFQKERRIDIHTKRSTKNSTHRPPSNMGSSQGQAQSVVVIGTSTGGPRALQNVIPLIPGNAGASFLIVQHMPPGFTKSLADRLNSMSEITVKEAEDGEIIFPGYAYIAPGNYHLEVKQGTNSQLFISLTQSMPISGHRPSVDALFSSIANLRHNNVLGVIMTGMGSDGTQGIIDLKDKLKAHIIAQDEASSVVYGMPKSAVNTGKVDEIVPLGKIAERILKQLGV